MADITVRLIGADSREVEVNDAGELMVALGPYDLVKFNDMDVADQAYNFYSPRGTDQFVVTGFLAFGDKDINDATDSTVVIYEASAPDTTTVDRTLFQFEVGKLVPVPFTSLKILCNFGKYINAKTNDDDVHMTMLGYFVDLKGKGKTE
jgi:hypothetical protein